MGQMLIFAIEDIDMSIAVDIRFVFLTRFVILISCKPCGWLCTWLRWMHLAWMLLRSPYKRSGLRSNRVGFLWI